jgi:hypothetical protein
MSFIDLIRTNALAASIAAAIGAAAAGGAVYVIHVPAGTEEAPSGDVFPLKFLMEVNGHKVLCDMSVNPDMSCIVKVPATNMPFTAGYDPLKPIGGGTSTIRRHAGDPTLIAIHHGVERETTGISKKMLQIGIQVDTDTFKLP